MRGAVLHSAVTKQNDGSFKVSLYTGNIAQVGIYVDLASANFAAKKASEAVNEEASELLASPFQHEETLSKSNLVSSMIDFRDDVYENDEIENMKENDLEEKDPEQLLNDDMEESISKPAPTAASRELKSYQIPIEGLLHAGSCSVSDDARDSHSEMIDQNSLGFESFDYIQYEHSILSYDMTSIDDTLADIFVTPIDISMTLMTDEDDEDPSAFTQSFVSSTLTLVYPESVSNDSIDIDSMDEEKQEEMNYFSVVSEQIDSNVSSSMISSSSSLSMISSSSSSSLTLTSVSSSFLEENLLLSHFYHQDVDISLQSSESVKRSSEIESEQSLPILNTTLLALSNSLSLWRIEALQVIHAAEKIVSSATISNHMVIDSLIEEKDTTTSHLSCELFRSDEKHASILLQTVLLHGLLDSTLFRNQNENDKIDELDPIAFPKLWSKVASRHWRAGAVDITRCIQQGGGRSVFSTFALSVIYNRLDLLHRLVKVHQTSVSSPLPVRVVTRLLIPDPRVTPTTHPDLYTELGVPEVGTGIATQLKFHLVAHNISVEKMAKKLGILRVQDLRDYLEVTTVVRHGPSVHMSTYEEGDELPTWTNGTLKQMRRSLHSQIHLAAFNFVQDLRNRNFKRANRGYKPLPWYGIGSGSIIQTTVPISTLLATAPLGIDTWLSMIAETLLPSKARKNLKDARKKEEKAKNKAIREVSRNENNSSEEEQDKNTTKVETEIKIDGIKTKKTRKRQSSSSSSTTAGGISGSSSSSSLSIPKVPLVSTFSSFQPFAKRNIATRKDISTGFTISSDNYEGEVHDECISFNGIAAATFESNRCSVCATGTGDKPLCCSKCKIRVHSYCYGLGSLVHGPLENWLCDLCKLPFPNVLSKTCELCSRDTAGLACKLVISKMILPDDNDNESMESSSSSIVPLVRTFVHVICAVSNPFTTYKWGYRAQICEPNCDLAFFAGSVATNEGLKSVCFVCHKEDSNAMLISCGIVRKNKSSGSPRCTSTAHASCAMTAGMFRVTHYTFGGKAEEISTASRTSANTSSGVSWSGQIAPLPFQVSSTSRAFSDLDLPPRGIQIDNPTADLSSSSSSLSSLSSSTRPGLKFTEPLVRMKAALQYATTFGYSPGALCIFSQLLWQLENGTVHCNRLALVRNVSDVDGYASLASIPMPKSIPKEDLCKSFEPRLEPTDEARDAILAHTFTLDVQALIRRRDFVTPLPLFFTARLVCLSHAKHNNPCIDVGRRSVGRCAGSINGRIIPPWIRGLDAKEIEGGFFTNVGSMPLIQTEHDPKTAFPLVRTSLTSSISLEDQVFDAPWIRGCISLLDNTMEIEEVRNKVSTFLDAMSPTDEEDVKKMRHVLMTRDFPPIPLSVQSPSLSSHSTEKQSAMVFPSKMVQSMTLLPHLGRDMSSSSSSFLLPKKKSKQRKSVHFHEENTKGESSFTKALVETKESSNENVSMSMNANVGLITSSTNVAIDKSAASSSSSMLSIKRKEKVKESKEKSVLTSSSSSSSSLPLTINSKEKEKEKTVSTSRTMSLPLSITIKKDKKPTGEKKMSGRGWYYVTDSEDENEVMEIVDTKLLDCHQTSVPMISIHTSLDIEKGRTDENVIMEMINDDKSLKSVSTNVFAQEVEISMGIDSTQVIYATTMTTLAPMIVDDEINLSLTTFDESLDNNNNNMMEENEIEKKIESLRDLVIATDESVSLSRSDMVIATEESVSSSKMVITADESVSIAPVISRRGGRRGVGNEGDFWML